MGKKIKLAQVTEGTRAVSAKLTFMQDGEPVTDDFTIVYRQQSPAAARALETEMREKFPWLYEPDAAERLGEAMQAHDKSYLAEKLARLVSQIPEIVGDDDLPVELSAADFDAFELKNLKAISDAINDDLNPNPTPSAS